MINQTVTVQSQDLIANLNDKNIQHHQELVELKKKLANSNRYAAQKSVLTKKLKTAEDNAVTYLEMMNEIVNEVDSANLFAHSAEKRYPI